MTLMTSLNLSVLLGQTIVRISEEIIDLIYDSIVEQERTRYINHFRFRGRENSLFSMLVAVLISVLIIVVITMFVVVVVTMFIIVLITMFISMFIIVIVIMTTMATMTVSACRFLVKWDSVNTIALINRDTEVTPVSCL